MATQPRGETAARSALDPRLLLPVVLGVALAVGLYRVWNLEFRWFAVVVGGIAGVSGAMVLLGNIGRLGFYAFLFAMPLAGIEKWFFKTMLPAEWQGSFLYSGLIGVGPIDVILLGVYASWLFRIFVSREEPLPEFQKIDFLVLMLPLAYAISLLGAPRIYAGVFAIVYLLKHVLAYFYLSRNVRRHHLAWIVASILFAIVLQAGVGLAQSQFHVLRGIARDKGAGESERQEQYEVPGIETKIRAEGLLLDSHAFGVWMAMALALPFVLAQAPRTSRTERLLYTGVFLIGVMALVFSYSRSAWVAFAVSLVWGILLMMMTGHPGALRGLVVSIVATIAISPFAAYYVWERFARAPGEIMGVRFEGYEVAWTVWQDHLLFGYGVGNYLDALRRYSFNFTTELPVHNVVLWIGTETGLFGLFVFYGLIVAAALRFWKLAIHGRGLIRQLAYWPLIAFAAYVLDGMTEPLYREPVVYMLFWLMIALSVGLTRLDREERAAAPAAIPQAL